METQHELPCPQMPAIGFFPEPLQSNSQHEALFI